MIIIKAHNLVCPIDNAVLLDTGKQLCCDNGHSYDISRQGYVNLLPVQHKRSKDPGDSKEMVQARTLFLNSGLYQPIVEQIVSIITSLIHNDQNSNMCVVDAGCGEGYYLDFIVNALAKISSSSSLSFIGLDISKFAVIAATKRNASISWLVGTNRRPPILEASVDIILCVFGFHNFDGFKKILKSNAVIILVEPGPDHLKELRDIIYSDVKKSESTDVLNTEISGFSHVSSEYRHFMSGNIGNETLSNLLLMTPHFFRATKQGREAASKIQEINLTIDIVISVLRKDN